MFGYLNSRPRNGGIRCAIGGRGFPVIAHVTRVWVLVLAGRSRGSDWELAAIRRAVAFLVLQAGPLDLSQEFEGCGLRPNWARSSRGHFARTSTTLEIQMSNHLNLDRAQVVLDAILQVTARPVSTTTPPMC
jgi:hypothetical protein